jgi:L-fuculose-phosphate aldolase
VLTEPRDIADPADRLVEAMRRIYGYRMTTTSGGNLSIRDADGTVWITPARVDKGTLSREDIVRVGTDGTVSGRHPASSELPFHLGVYRERPDIRAIVHAHPVAMVAFSICGQIPDTNLFAKSRSICGPVGFAPYALPGSALLGEKIAEVFAAGFHCVMLENHGVVVGGATFQQAFERFETLEFTAKTLIKAAALGGASVLPPALHDLAARRGGELPGFVPGPATALERTARRVLCDFVRRGYRQRLLTSTAGSFSARVSGSGFVITPAGADRAVIDPEDLVLIDSGKREAGKSPSHAWNLHAAIYAKHPEIHAIVNATPVNATAFAVSSQLLDSRTIPESFVFLRDVGKIPCEQIYHATAEFEIKRPVSLVENDGVIVLGRTILDAFDRLEVLEATAEAILNSLPLAPLKPMPDHVIEELEQAFPAG